MILHIEPKNGIPIFQQIIQQVKYKLAAGVLEAGEQLPSVRQLASSLRVNPNTVAKAYTELEREDVIVTKRGMGCFVSEKPVSISNNERLKILSEQLDRCLTEAYYLGIPWDEVQQLFQQRIEAISKRSQK